MDAYTLVNQLISPSCVRPPISSHMEIVVMPILSATLYDLTSCLSLVLGTCHMGTHPICPELQEGTGCHSNQGAETATEHPASQTATHIQLGLKSEVRFIVLEVIKDPLLYKLSSYDTSITKS